MIWKLGSMVGWTLLGRSSTSFSIMQMLFLMPWVLLEFAIGSLSTNPLCFAFWVMEIKDCFKVYSRNSVFKVQKLKLKKAHAPGRSDNYLQCGHNMIKSNARARFSSFCFAVSIVLTGFS